ncbi:ThiJ/PfpI family protein [Fulvivirga imtechensis AK7]|uniref:ThiJ/PfpI family protein n=2 Tax=Fulvivirga TaxID=396811 RepID=L8JST0_9BACT|nr:ThiJ/PfpI family protein [Fulvivirga imtechensis AK7]
MILTSHKELNNTDKTTGVWLGEFTDPYYEFIDKGYEVVLASPKGGEPPLDPRSKLTENITSSNRRFDDDADAQQKFKSTFSLSEVSAADFDALFFPGGHGPMWDLATDDRCAQLIVDFYSQKKPIAAVCHGPAALVRAAELKPEILRGKKVTAFSNKEEVLVGLADNIPFKLQDRLKELGADYDASFIPFTSKVRVDGLLITGENPASAEPAAKKLIETLEKQPSKIH